MIQKSLFCHKTLNRVILIILSQNTPTEYKLNRFFGQNKMFWHSVHSRLIGHAFQVLFKTKKCGLISSFWTSWNFQKFYGKLIIICCLMIMKTLMTLASASIHPSFVCTSCRTCWVVNMGWASSFSWLWCIVLITHVIYRREEKKGEPNQRAVVAHDLRIMQLQKPILDGWYIL